MIQDIINIARREIGTTENPVGSNNVKYNTWYYGREVSGVQFAWCACFVFWVMTQAKFAYPWTQRSVYCPYMVNEAKRGVNGLTWISSTRDMRPGDIIFFGTTGVSHVGIIVDTSGGVITTVEGNTSDSVRQKTYSPAYAKILGAARPKYPDTESTVVPESVVERGIRSVRNLATLGHINSPDLWIEKLNAGDENLAWLFIKWETSLNVEGSTR